MDRLSLATRRRFPYHRKRKVFELEVKRPQGELPSGLFFSTLTIDHTYLLNPNPLPSTQLFIVAITGFSISVHLTNPYPLHHVDLPPDANDAPAPSSKKVLPPFPLSISMMNS